MKTLLKNGRVLTAEGFEKRDVTIVHDRITFSSNPPFDKVIHCNHKFIVPGFVDVHVHLREPGFFYKESIRTGTMAAARGGYTAVCAMPNLNPAPDTLEHLNRQLEIIGKDAVTRVYPYGTITRGPGYRNAPTRKLDNSPSTRKTDNRTLSQMEAMKDLVIGFSDDGKGVQSQALMEAAMIKAKECNKIIAAHCEDETLTGGGYIHKGSYAEKNNHRGICSESEWKQVQRDLKLCKKTGASYHVCHVSTKETVELVRQAKCQNIDVTCEVTPHHLILCEDDLQEDGRFKMNPPLRTNQDREALIQGINDGTVDMIATDHAPHSKEEKSKGLADSALGVVGLETAFPILYTYLVKPGILTIEKLIALMSTAPGKRFNIPGGYLTHGQKADLAILDLEAACTIDPGDFLSKGKSTPFEGMKVTGENIMTIVDGKIVWEKTKEKTQWET